jgi:general secretion pathway protein A
MAVKNDESGLLLYEPYYGLVEKPFSLSTDPRFLFKSPSHAPVFQDVLAGIRRREGLVVLTGEIGMGKTTICRSVLDALDRKTFSAFVPDPFVSREDLLKILLVEFGVVSVDDLVRGRLQGASRAELSYPLYEFLRSLEPLDAFAVLLLDEAQNLPAALLEEIRILSDLEGARKLLQVVLIGQPELSDGLRQPYMRQMRQRVTTHTELQPLTRDGVYGYVGHRLAVAGATADRLRFTGEALDLVFAATGGVPRVINRLCDRTLQRGHAARVGTIDVDLVRVAVADLQIALSSPLADVRASAVGHSVEVAPPPTEAETEAALDDLRALLSLPSMAVPPAEAPPTVGDLTLPEPERTPLTPRPRLARPRPRGQAPRSNRARTVAAVALIVLGAMSGMTLGVYWVWAGPLLTERASLPVVRRPSARIGAPLPAVLPPALDLAIDDLLEAPAGSDLSDEPEHPAPVTAAPTLAPTAPFAAQSLWVVQVAAFADDARAGTLIAQLSARGLTAFKGASLMRSGATLHLVLVGPYATRAAASAGLERVMQVPGVGAGEPILQLVPPAPGVR